MTNENDVREAVLVDEPNEKSVVKSDAAGILQTLDELSSAVERGRMIMEARVEILKGLRRASIAATTPSDWVLFKSPEGQITAFLQDAGADRIRPLWGIQINPTEVVKQEMEDGSFSFTVRGNGHCTMTGDTILMCEGVRYSTEDFVKYDTGKQRETKVAKAARANFDGGITRELAGLRNVPVEELADVWAGTKKSWQSCPKGRGFGTKQERMGAQVREGSPPPQDSTGAVDQGPSCPNCGGRMNFVAAGKKRDGNPYPAFWSCVKFRSGECKGAVQHSDWQKSQAAKTQPQSQPQTGDNPNYSDHDPEAA